ncbi:uncharacterized protein F4822DRAFT_423069 [Hypoxylon trugodes]|uniref:uncharacterized protein n=1 Tax=Hypoxylon trugodes TaxID=326681 RepID=UPI00219C938C|nr:uncharacterized protein F4822DRAFT_423069 [Hypoxylon trugodes]KAI1382630.1 hypothetical protein F4822DRAFT_423069 [Hypoxylon trugodes]
MLFSESDAPLLRAWIIRRLANTSDADADVLADYVLALLRHDGDADSIRKIFEEEIPDFLREDAASFTNDVFQAIKYHSYIPGAAPPPPLPLAPRHTLPPPPVPASVPGLPPQYQPQLPFPPAQALPTAPSLGQGGSRKRSYNDRDDKDVDIILTSRDPYPGHHPYKQARRGGGFSQRGGRFDESYRPRDHRGFPNAPYQPPPSNSPFGQLPPPPPFPSQHDQGMSQLDPTSLIENIQRLQQLGIPIPQINDLPKPVYSGTIPPPRRRKQRCRDYEARGYCPRGNNCKFEHSVDSLMVPPLGPPGNDEYDPNNAVFSMPVMSNQPQPQGFPPLNLPSFSMPSPNNRREHNKSRRTKGRPAFAASGPVHDKSKTSIVVQNIPNENFSEDKIRGYFTQFGSIAEVSLQGHDKLAIIKFDTWDAANAAWSSPKVIFDNRFVKVFWYKDESEARSSPTNGRAGNGVKNGITNGDASAGEGTPVEPFDMEEFTRKQEEAQKAHDEKMKKREELDRQRQELEERQKELRERQLEEKRKLQARLSQSGKTTPSDGTDGAAKKFTSQTEALRAKLAELEQEADVLGIDPDAAQDEYSSWNPRGGRGSRGYRGRGRYAPRARGIRGGYGYQAKGGLEARHAAYAAYSLDNRPKIIALTGVDFTNPEKDEPLRQYLFGIGEFKEIHTDPTTTHITFNDRKTAEQFMFGVSANNSIPGIEDKIEIMWATSAPQTENKATADGDVPMSSGIEDEQTAKDKVNTEDSSATAGLEEGEVESSHVRDQRDMDYEAGEDWGIS